MAGGAGGRAGYGGQAQVPGAGSLPPDFPNQLLSLPADPSGRHLMKKAFYFGDFLSGIPLHILICFSEVTFIIHCSFQQLLFAGTGFPEKHPRKL